MHNIKGIIEVPEVRGGAILPDISLTFSLDSIENALYDSSGGKVDSADIAYNVGEEDVCATLGAVSLEYCHAASRLFLLYSDTTKEIQTKFSLPLSAYGKKPASICDMIAISDAGRYGEITKPRLNFSEHHSLKEARDCVVKVYSQFEMRQYVLEITRNSRKRAFGFLGDYLSPSLRTTTP